MTTLTQAAQNPLHSQNLASKIFHAKGLPQFSAKVYEDPLNFLTRFEMVGQVHNWLEA